MSQYDIAVEHTAILRIIEQYFLGLHHADTTLLANIFHEDCVLKAPGIRRTLNEWLTLVSQREVPATRGDAFSYRVISLSVEGDQAMAKVYCPLLGAQFFDYLGLLREQSEWKIVNKMYADAAPYLIEKTTNENH